MFFLLFCVIIFTVTPSAAAEEETLLFVSQEFKPYSYESDGKVLGPVSEIIKRVCLEMKTSCSFNIYPWPRAQQVLYRGNSNAIFVIGKNPEREKRLNFSLPIITAEYGFFVRSDNPLKFKSVSDIKGYLVGAYGPSNTSDTLKNIQAEIRDLALDITPHDEHVFKKLAHGRVDAAFSNKDVGHSLTRDLMLENIRYAGSYKTLDYYIGFSKKQTHISVVKKFNEAYYRLYRTGIISSILAPYNLKPAIITQPPGINPH